MRSWVWLPAGVAQQVVTNPWDAVPVSTLACLAGWVLAGLRAACSLSGRSSAAVWSVPGCVSCLMVDLCLVGLIALQPAPVQPYVVFVVFSVRSEVCSGRPVRCGGYVATGAHPMRGVGSPVSWPPVVGPSGVCVVVCMGPAGPVWSL